MNNESYDGKDSASVSPIGMVLGGFSFAVLSFNLMRIGAANRPNSDSCTMHNLYIVLD